MTAAVSYDGAGNMLNRVDRKYNYHGIVTREHQRHNAQSAGVGPQYFYDDEPPYKASRVNGLRYPCGAPVGYDYSRSLRTDHLRRLLIGPKELNLEDVDADELRKIIKQVNKGQESQSKIDRAVGRVASLHPFIAAYEFLGERNTVGVELLGGSRWPHQVVLQNLESEDKPLARVDEMYRQTEVDWRGPDLKQPGWLKQRVKYGFSYHSLRRYRKMHVSGKDWSESYQYDGRDRLRHALRGDVNNLGVDEVPRDHAHFAQQWSHDACGNWLSFKQDNDGGGTTQQGKETWDFKQIRQHNALNQITSIQTAGAAEWITPVYDQAGNSVVIPQPNNPQEKYFCDYDAWGRLVRVNQPVAGNQKQAIAEYDYDALGRRIVKRRFHDGALAEARHFYYSPDWHLLEERVVPFFQLHAHNLLSDDQLWCDAVYYWGMQGQDDLVLRYRPPNFLLGRLLPESLRPLPDGNKNITTLVNQNGDVAERFHFDPYGKPYFLDKDFQVQNGSANKWTHLYGGYFYDVETGLYQVRRRMYHPTLGVWLTPDPSGSSVGPNLYQYCGCNPINAIDPNGDVFFIPFLIAGAKILFATYIGKVIVDTAISTGVEAAIANKTGQEFHLGSAVLRNLGGAMVTHAIPGLGEARFATKVALWTARLATRTAAEAAIESYIHETNYAANLAIMGIGNVLGEGVSKGLGRAFRGIMRGSTKAASKRASSRVIYTHVNDLEDIVDARRLWGLTEGAVYGMRIPNARWWRTWGRKLREGHGTVVFRGQATDLFSPHPVEGLFSGLKRLLGQQKSQFGDIVFRKWRRVGSQIHVWKADIDLHIVQSRFRAASRLFRRRLFDVELTEFALAAAIALGYNAIDDL